MGDVVIESVGGYTGGGEKGRVAWSALSAADQAKVNALFTKGTRSVNANLKYRLTRDGPSGPETVEALPQDVPEALILSLKRP